MPTTLRTFAYCCESMAPAAQRAAGVKPVTSPPTTFDVFNPHWLLNNNFLYFQLHGLPDQEWWYGDEWTTAMHCSAIEDLRLPGVVVFVANCHFNDHWKNAWSRTGAIVYGGEGPNWAQARGLSGAALLGYYLRQALERELPGSHPDALFAKALQRLAGHKRRLETLARFQGSAQKALSKARAEAAADTLQFKRMV